MSDRALRRAGLDYHEYAHVQVHPSLDALATVTDARRWFAFTTKASRAHVDAAFQAGDTLLFGPETRGLPDDVLDARAADFRLRIPMRAHARSLNLSNAVAIAAYEAWRQFGFSGV